ncbi:glycosyltransferase [Nocardia rhizosphaerihabitans]|uniref:glycosyltransferase n=1 Tax=Nocardia rhizosphaerihabitans TaxID=1691570 RepID=UPI00366FB85F
MRILFSSTPAHGHLLPMVPLERAARWAGHVTAFLTHGSVADVVAPAEVLSAGATLEESLAVVHRRTGADATTDMSPATVAEFFGGARIDLGADESLAAAAAFAPDLIVAEAADFLGPLVASKLGVPWISHAVGIAVDPAIAEAVVEVAAQRMKERNIELAPPIAAVDPWPESLQSETWEPSRDRIDIRPEAPESEHDAPWTAPSFPGRAELPRVLVTLGTIVDEPGTLTAIIDSLLEQEVNIVVAVHPASDPRDLTVDASRVHVTGFVPMRNLLDGVDVVVSSGGAGTVLSVLSAAVPMVILPLGLDKPLNAERAAAVGVAAVIHDPRQAGAAAVRILGTPSFAVAATEMAARIAAMKPADEVLALLLDRIT